MKTEKVKIDKIDERILEMLKEDCKMPVKNISKATERPITTIYSKIKKMERAGVIKGYKAVIDDKKIGMGVTAFIFLTTDSSTSTDDMNMVDPHKMAEEITSFSQVEEVRVITGSWDIMVKVKGSSIDEIGDVVLSKIRTVKGVSRTLTIISLDKFMK